jgi:hypothetical protein
MGMGVLLLAGALAGMACATAEDGGDAEVERVRAAMERPGLPTDLRHAVVRRLLRRRTTADAQGAGRSVSGVAQAPAPPR